MSLPTSQPKRTPAAPKGSRSRGPAPGPGKQPKIFPEELGLSHLLALTRQITGAKEAVTQSRMDKGKEREETVLRARKERNRKIAQRKKGGVQEEKGAGVGVEGTGWGKDGGRDKERFPKDVVKKVSKTSLKNSLKAQVREKNKARKQARKVASAAAAEDSAAAAAAATADEEEASSAPPAPPSRKRVRMAEGTKEEDAHEGTRPGVRKRQRKSVTFA